MAGAEGAKAEPSPGHRHHLYPDEEGFHVSGGGHRPVQQVCGQLIAAQYHGCRVVQGNDRRCHRNAREA